MRPALFIIVFLAAAAFVSLAHDQVLSAMQEFLMLLIRPLGILLTWISSALQALVRFIRAQHHEESGRDTPSTVRLADSMEPDGNSDAHDQTHSVAAGLGELRPITSPHDLSKFIGAVVFTALTALFGAAEYYLARMALAAMMGIPSDVNPAFSPDVFSAVAMLAVSAFWGLILIDVYRGTHLLPELFLLKFRKPLKLMAWSAIVCSLAALMVLAAWRGIQVAKPVRAASLPMAEQTLTINGTTPTAPTASVSPQSESLLMDDGSSGFSAFAIIFFPAALAGLVGLSMVLSFTGVIYLLRYVGLLVLALAAIPLIGLLLPLRLFEQVLLTLSRLAAILVGLIARFGTGTINTFGPPLSQFRAWAHTKVGSALGSVGASSAQAVPARESESTAESIDAGSDGTAKESDMGVDEQSQFTTSLRDFNWGS